ncbi:MAG: hypothetical protein CL702_04930, partial [Chloroflexi bacterium]|nr:hypothetical protein [Chloroflexota bacterium]
YCPRGAGETTGVAFGTVALITGSGAWVAVGMGRVVAVGAEVGRTAGTDVGEVASTAGITVASDVAVGTGVASDGEAAPEQATAIMTIPGTASLPKIFRYLIQPLLPLPR